MRVLSGLLLMTSLAGAADIPGIEGHLTDSLHRVSKADKDALEDRLGKIQQDTHIDVAAWLTEAPAASLSDLGTEAYRRWNIGKEWDNGIFFVIPPSGPARMIQDRARPALTPGEEARVLAADSPSQNMTRRVELLADAAGALLRSKLHRARPYGQNDPRRGLAYALLAGGIALAAFASSASARSRQLRRAALPTPSAPARNGG